MSSDVWGNDQQIVMPFYLICDVSASMWREMDALHAGVVRLRRAILGHPVLDDVARICVMTFSDDARIVIDLTQMSDLREEVPKFGYENSTQYGAAFRALAKAMAADYGGLRREGHMVYRPCVYFLTDGEPSDADWRQVLAETLTAGAMARMGVPSYPIIVPFGFRDATGRTMRRLAYPPGTSRWYHASSSTVEEALEGLLGIITNSVLASTGSALAGDPEHILPPPDPAAGIDYGTAEDDPES